MTIILILIIAAFVIYAVATQYKNTPADGSVAARTWASLVAAAGALGALVMSLFKSGATP